MDALVGYTGFVGSNLLLSRKFDGLYNSQNIQEAFGQPFDTVIYAGVRAEKYLANQQPAKDWELIQAAMENIQRLRARRFVLISTVDVYWQPVGVDEASPIDVDHLPPYGLHRYRLEQWVQANVAGATIVRLPGLYGPHLKKNFIFDMLQISPALIAEAKFADLRSANLAAINLDRYYTRQPNGHYRVNTLSDPERQTLKRFFQTQAFNALSFTDSRNYYQFYPLARLWDHLALALEHGLRLVCLNSAPVEAGALYRYLFGQDFKNEILAQPVTYDLRSRFAEVFGGRAGYVFDRDAILVDIRRFVQESLR